MSICADEESSGLGGRCEEVSSPTPSKTYHSDLRARYWWQKSTHSLETMQAGGLRGCPGNALSLCWKQIKSLKDFLWIFTPWSLRCQRGRLTEKGEWHLNVCRILKTSVTGVLSWIFVFHLPSCLNALAIFFTKDARVRSLLTHNGSGTWRVKESHPSYCWKSLALPDRPGKRGHLKKLYLLPSGH